MIDREYLEQTGLHVMDLLDDSERTAYEQELKVNPSLRSALRDAGEQVAAVALTAPQYEAPAHLLAQIEQRVHHPRTATLRQGVSRHSLLKIHPAWAAAAALALMAGGMGISQWRTAERLRELEARLLEKESGPAGGAGRSSVAGTSAPDAADALPSAPPGKAPARQGDKSLVLRSVGLPAEVKRELDRLRSLERSLTASPAGVADLRIMELRPPGSPLPARTDRNLLSSKVAEAVSAALSGTHAPGDGKEPPPLPPEPARVRGKGSAPTNDIVIEGGGTVNIPGLNLHPDARVVHKDFPGPAEYARYGLTPLENGAVWDGHGSLWYPQAGGKTWLGQRAPQGFIPPDPDEPGSVAAPGIRPPPAETSPPADGPQHSQEPYALPLTGKDGTGMIVTQNLPAPAAGQGYALWSVGEADQPPVLLGFLPPGESSTGVFAFQLPEGTPLPNGYRITTEPIGTTTPGTHILLEGP